jgi:Zn-dependent protease
VIEMTDTFRLCRIRGVAVGLNWSVLAMAVLLTTGLANSRLPLDRPGYPTAAYWLAGSAATVVLLAGVLVHELAHAIVARRAGMQVGGITLWFMGGMTRIEGEARKPAVELGVSGIGPLVSAAIGGLCWLAHLVGSQLGMDPLPLDALGWLALINVGLAAFNLLPAAPLDGGRVLHAGVWALTRDRWRATQAASRAGMLFGLIVGAAGAVLFVRGDSIDGLLVAGLGWFLFISARAEEQLGAARRLLDGVTVADLMRPVRAAPGWLTVDTLLARPATPPGAVLMLEAWAEPGYAGVVSRDTLEAVPLLRRSALRALDVAVPIQEVRGAGPGDDVLDALTRHDGERLLLVIDGGRTVGALLPADVERCLQAGVRPPSRRAEAETPAAEPKGQSAPVH